MHLFAGAGGGILADLLLGHTPVCAVEINAYCRNVLLARQRDGILPRFPIWDDVRTFDGRQWRGQVDCVSGGFPCQDISCAGKGKGITGERSGLWSEFARIIGEVQSTYVFVENSPMLVSRGLEVVLGNLSALGYDAKWGIVSAENVGAPHKRKRLWPVASNNRGERIQGGISEEVCGESFFSRGKNVRRFADVQRRSNVFTPTLCRTQHDVAHYVDRIKAIGNGQIPVVAALAWKLLSGK